MRTGQVIGATDKIGAYAVARRIQYQDVLATIYHNLGIDPHTFVKDSSDRPTSILPEGARPDRRTGLRPAVGRMLARDHGRKGNHE